MDRYDCAQAFSRLDAYLDRELSSAEMDMVREHLMTCEVCAGEFHFERSVLDGVRAKLQRIAVPEELHQRVLTALREAEAHGS